MDRAGWGGVFAVSMYQIRAAWEIRMYAMGTALVAVSTWLLLRALFAPVQRWGAWAAYAAAALAFAYTHYFALLFARGLGGVRGWILWRRVVREDRGIAPGGQAGRLHHKRTLAAAGRGGNSGDTHLIRVVFWFWTGLLRLEDTTYDLLQPSKERLVPERSTGADVLAQVPEFLFRCGTFEERVPVADHRQQGSNPDQAIVPG